MLNIDKRTAMLCSIALFEFSLTHKKDLPELSKEARKISDAIDEMIESKLFEMENQKMIPRCRSPTNYKDYC